MVDMITISRIGILNPCVTDAFRPNVGSSSKISARRWLDARPRTSWHRVRSLTRQRQREQTERQERIRWSSWLLLQAMQTALLLSVIDEQDDSLPSAPLSCPGQFAK